MIKKEISFSDLIDFFKKNETPTFDDEIDKFGGYFITAARIAAVILAPDPLTKIGVFCTGVSTASLKASKLFSWLPDKFKYKDREKTALEKYELASYVNYILLQIAIKNGVKEVIMPLIKDVLNVIKLSKEDKKELELKSNECDKERSKLSIPCNSSLSGHNIKSQADKLVDPIFKTLHRCIEECNTKGEHPKKIDLSTTKKAYIENVTIQYHALLINFSEEFPEFALWADITKREEILKELKSTSETNQGEMKKLNDQFIARTEELINKIERLKDDSFVGNSGFPTFMNSYRDLFLRQEEKIVDILKGRTMENIAAHQKEIKKELDKRLSYNTDVEQIVYPLNKDIFIAQSFEAINYVKKTHRKGFLTADSLGDGAEQGQDIGKYLLRTLVNPNYALRPIILLGNPGAGKSMLSKMFAAQLCETNDFIPFLIKLRSVASSSSSISEHINKGLQKSIENTSDLNWLEWAKKFKNRIPVVIMDGFDELMQTSNRELNGYVDAIREFQEKAISNGVCVRIILTSRITVMQDVSIPEHTKIIKLDSFDVKRINLWIQKWNTEQKKPKYKFAIPKNDKIELLAKEPLLMFMLAVYDFDSADLQNMANDKSFNQSKLYDSLLNRFIKRQLTKNSFYNNAGTTRKKREEELFRLRLGMIALMMFMNDTTSRDTQKLSDEMKAFGIEKSTMQTENILGGFFFIHENKSTTESEIEKFNYEFLHKTFGEFLAADFLLRVAKKQAERILTMEITPETISQKDTLNFCFGYNWLHKHYNIQNFLFEHAPHIIKPKSRELKSITNLIKTDLKGLFDKVQKEFPVTTIRLLENKNIIEHLGIYSQNLIFLWLAIAENGKPIKIDLFDLDDGIGNVNHEPKYESQDRDEINKNKLLWKRLSKLWTLVGNNGTSAKLKEWVAVNERAEFIELSQAKSEVVHNFSNAAEVACNDFELLISYFDTEFKFQKDQSYLRTIDNIVSKKPELATLAYDVVLHRFYDLFAIEGMQLITWFINSGSGRKQTIKFLKKVNQLNEEVHPRYYADIVRRIGKDPTMFIRDDFQAIIEYLRILVRLKPVFHLDEILDADIFLDILRRSEMSFERHARAPVREILEYARILTQLSYDFQLREKPNAVFPEEAFYYVGRRMRHSIKTDPLLGLDYLKLLNELFPLYYSNREIDPRLYEKPIYSVFKSLEYLTKDSSWILEGYLRVCSQIAKHIRRDDEVFPDLFIRVVGLITQEWEYLFKDKSFSPLHHIALITRTAKLLGIEKHLWHKHLRRASYEISRRVPYLAQSNPKLAYEHIQCLKGFDKKHFIDEVLEGDYLERILPRRSNEFRDETYTFLIYVELLFINILNGKRAEIGNLIDFLIKMLHRRKYPSHILMKASVILTQYRVPASKTPPLLDAYPEFKSLISRSPELAMEVLEATNEIIDYERFD